MNGIRHGSRATFLADMQAGRDNAKARRDNGGSTVTVYATAAAAARRHGPRSELDQLEDWFKQRQHELHLDCYAAVEFALFSHTWEGFEL